MAKGVLAARTKSHSGASMRGTHPPRGRRARRAHSGAPFSPGKRLSVVETRINSFKVNPMKALSTTRGTLAYALLLCCACTLAIAADSPSQAPRTEVIFDSPDNYTDWKLSDGGDWYRDSVFTAIRGYLAKQADHLLPDGYKLRIKFTDIDLGHRSLRRIPSASGAPAFTFTYLVTDSSGTVVRQGAGDLRHYTDFGNYRFSVETTDLTTEIIQDEKPMLKSWAFTKLADLKQR